MHINVLMLLPQNYQNQSKLDETAKFGSFLRHSIVRLFNSRCERYGLY